MEDMSSLAERILDQIADAVIYTDRTGVIRRWSRGAAAVFGYNAAEALGQNLDLIIPEDLRAPHWRGFQAAMTSGVMKLEGRPTLSGRRRVATAVNDRARPAAHLTPNS
jgi:PAS domain S-box-containing protein